MSYFHNYFYSNATVHKTGTRQATRGDLFKSLKILLCPVFKQFHILVLNFGEFIRVANSVAVFRSKLKTHITDSCF